MRKFRLAVLVSIAMWLLTRGIADLLIGIGVQTLVAYIAGFLLMSWLMVSISIAGKKL